MSSGPGTHLHGTRAPVLTMLLLLTLRHGTALRSAAWSTRSRSLSWSGLSVSPTSLAGAASPTFGIDLVRRPDGGDYDATVLVGRTTSLARLLASSSFITDTLRLSVPRPVLDALLGEVTKKTGGTATSYVTSDDDDDAAHHLALCGLPAEVSRNDHPMSVHALTDMVGSKCPKRGHVRVVVVTDAVHDDGIAPLASAVAKAFPAYSRKTSTPQERDVAVIFCRADGTVVDDPDQLRAARAVAEGVRLAARLVDTPPEELTTDHFAAECRNIADELDGVTMTQLVGDELQDYGGLYNVGKAARCPPRLVVLEYRGGGDDAETVALVGKGIVYDTGGLSLKSKTGMVGMKHDMGGAAGVLGGFHAAVTLGVRKNVHLVLCLAENAIGPDAVRVDDVVTMYSGKTVEINNSDAEGRLVLGDGVAHATKHIKKLDLVVDMATLTGAQLIATGKRHAGILADTLELEQRAVKAGLRSGDLVFPLLYAPELLLQEFRTSKVADLKNSVKDRSNAQTSCAGHFIEAHLDQNYQGNWLHVDMAGPGSHKQRGTGYGVGLVLSILEAPGF